MRTRKRSSVDAADTGVTAVDRALSIVLAAEAAAQPIALADLARATGLYKSTILRLLASLMRSGMFVRNNDGRYSLGPLAFRLGRAYEATYQLREHVMPVLEWLIENGTESASFHVRQDEDTRVCLFRVDSHHSTLDSVRAGDLLPMHLGAPGKVLSKFERALKPQEKEMIEPITVSYGERDRACAAIAAPVFGPYGDLYGSLSLSGPRERFTPTAVNRMADLLVKAGADVTRSVGGKWPWPAREPSSKRLAGRQAVTAARTLRNTRQPVR